MLARILKRLRPFPPSPPLRSRAADPRAAGFEILCPRADEPTCLGETRQRPHLPIAGFVGLPLSGHQQLQRAIAGAGAWQMLSDARPLVVDCDGCWIDDTPVDSLGEWSHILAAGRLGDVEGAFALGWLDADGGVALARDGIGERTLYYAPLPQGLVFASTVTLLLRSGLISRELSHRALAAYLSCAYLPGRETLVRGVFELRPGEVITWRRGSLQHDWLWKLPASDAAEQDESSLTVELRRSLSKAVERRLPSDESVGVFLSGGLDSSLVVALACELKKQTHRKVAAGGDRIKTYSVSFGPEYANELEFSSAVARHCGTLHRIVELSPPTVISHLDEVIGMLSDPIGDPLTVPNALLFREASREVGVVLNGEGGDPCFGGPKNLPMLLAELYGDGVNGAGELSELRSRSYLRAHLKCYDDLPQMLSPYVMDSLRESPFETQLADYFRDSSWVTYVGRLQAMNIVLKGAHHILPKVDALSRPFGVLPRSPLFDRSVVELSMRIPAQWKLRGSVEKYLLKEAVRDLLPDTIVDRPKSGMLVPVEGWFQGPLRDAARERLLDGLGAHGIFRREYLERLVSGNLGGLRPRHGAKIWLLVTLEAWLRRVLHASIN